MPVFRQLRIIPAMSYPVHTAVNSFPVSASVSGSASQHRVDAVAGEHRRTGGPDRAVHRVRRVEARLERGVVGLPPVGHVQGGDLAGALLDELVPLVGGADLGVDRTAR